MESNWFEKGSMTTLCQYDDEFESSIRAENTFTVKFSKETLQHAVNLFVTYTAILNQTPQDKHVAKETCFHCHH
jgi:hypothetical protein